MHLIHRCLLAVWLAFWSVCASAWQSPTSFPESNTVHLRADQQEYRLGRHLMYLEDASGKRTFEDVRGSPEEFVQSDKDVLNFDITRSAYWLKVRIQNDTGSAGRWFLQHGDNMYQYLDLWFVEQGKLVRHIASGSMRPRSVEGRVDTRGIVFDVTLDDGAAVDVYVRGETGYVQLLPLTLWTPAGFFENQSAESAFHFCYIGIVVAMVVYNLFAYFALREKSYIFYFGYMSSTLLVQCWLNGVLGTNFFVGQPIFNNLAFVVFYDVTIIMSLLFSLEFLRPVGFEKLFIKLIFLLRLIGIVAGLIGGYVIWTAIFEISCIIAPVGLLTIGFRRAMSGDNAARYYLFGYGWFLLAMIVFFLACKNMIPFSNVTFYSIEIGGAFDAVLLSLALAQRVKQIKEEKELAQRLAISNHEAALKERQRIDQLKDDFLANTSHELRTPLNGMIGLAEGLLADTRVALLPEHSRQLGLIVASGRRLNTLVNDILDFSKLRHHDLTLSCMPVSLRDVADLVIGLLKPLARDKALALVNDISPELPLVFADEARLQQIFSNLIGNAIKFTAVGSIRLVAHSEENYIVVDVVDTGIGIPADKLDVIFESFNQGDGGIAREYGGTGLGLAVVKQLVELHGGTIQVSSTEGAGATFTFTLPIAKANLDDDPHLLGSQYHTLAMLDEHHVDLAVEAMPGEAQESVELSVIDKGALPPAVKGHILVVDDEPINREVLRAQLASVGYRISEAANGVDALALLLAPQQDPIELVLFDVMMPKMSGYDACRALRQRFSPERLPILFLTAKTRREDIVEGLRVGGNDYLVKPFSREELLARISLHLDIGRSHRELDAQHAVLEDSHKRLVQQEKLASIGLLSAGIAHEIKNPTSFMSISTQNVEKRLHDLQAFIAGLLDEDADEELVSTFRQRFEGLFSQIDLIKEGSERIQAIISGMRSVSRNDQAGQKDWFDPAEGVLATIELVKPTWKTLVDFDVSGLQKGIMVSGYASALNQVFTNLMVNAAQAIEDRLKADPAGVRGVIRISSRRDGDDVLIAFEDNGGGMPDDVKAKLFTPFFTTKDRDRGTGLGMGICVGILEEHGGRLEVESDFGRGTMMTVRLPVVVGGVVKTTL